MNVLLQVGLILYFIQQNTLPFFRQKRILSSLNVPRKYQPLVGLLRALSILPCALHIIKYIQIINLIPFRDAGGSLIIDSTRLEYGIATVWVRRGTLVFFFFFLDLISLNFFNIHSIVCPGRLLELDSYNKHDETMALSL
jgi:hypothetical protein